MLLMVRKEITKETEKAILIGNCWLPKKFVVIHSDFVDIEKFYNFISRKEDEEDYIHTDVDNFIREYGIIQLTPSQNAEFRKWNASVYGGNTYPSRTVSDAEYRYTRGDDYFD